MNSRLHRVGTYKNSSLDLGSCMRKSTLLEMFGCLQHFYVTKVISIKKICQHNLLQIPQTDNLKFQKARSVKKFKKMSTKTI